MKTYTPNTIYTVTPISAVTADTTSAGQLCAGAKAIGLTITGASLSNRTAAVTVTVSFDGTNYHSYSMLLSNTTNTNSQMLTRVSSVSVSGNGTTVVWFDPLTLGSILYFKVGVDVTDAGSPAGTFTVVSTITY